MVILLRLRVESYKKGTLEKKFWKLYFWDDVRKKIHDWPEPFAKWLKKWADPLEEWWQVLIETAPGICLLIAMVVPFAIGYLVFFLVVFGAGLLYSLARAYIIVEAFISIRHVPVGVYEEVSWAQYMPHL